VDVATSLRIAAVVTSLLILFGFMAFATDEAQRGSSVQLERIDGSAAAEKKRESRSGPVREVVDDANDVLLAPFDGVTGSRSTWIRQLVPAALGLLLYGLGLMLLANYLPKPRRAERDWRTA